MKKYKIFVLTTDIDMVLPNVLKSTFGNRPVLKERRTYNELYLEYDDATILFRKTHDYRDDYWKGFRCNEIFVDRKLIVNMNSEYSLKLMLDRTKFLDSELPHYKDRNNKLTYMWW